MKAVEAAFNQEKALVAAFSVIMNLRVDPRLKLYQQDKRDRVPVHRLLWVHLWRYVGWAWFGSIQCKWANIIYCLFSEKYKNIGVADGQSYGADSLCTFTIYGNKYKGRNKTGELFSPTYPGNIHCRGLQPHNQILDYEYWVRFPMSKTLPIPSFKKVLTAIN